ncbi:MAG: RNA polymerase sigma factor [Acidobacteriota bacterium]
MTREAYGSAYQQGFDQTVRFLVSRGIRSDSAREAAQAGWVNGWEQLHQLRNESFLKTWVNTIALNYHRQRLRGDACLCPLFEVSGKPAGNTTLAAIDIERILSACSPSDRQLFERWLRGATLSEIADEMGITSTAARIRFLRARRAVRTRLERAAFVRSGRETAYPPGMPPDTPAHKAWREPPSRGEYCLEPAA